MSIAVRRGRAVPEARSRLLRFERSSSTSAAGRTLDRASTPHDVRHELARLALDVIVRTAEPIDVPRRWTGFAFAREVEQTRAQLAPIRSRDALAASYSREASIAATRSAIGSPPLTVPPGPVRVAYGIRWLELADRRPRPAWESIIAGVAIDVALVVTGPEDQTKGEIAT